MYSEISEKYIIETLQSYEEKTALLRKEMCQQYAQLYARDTDTLDAAVYHSLNTNVPLSDNSDISDIIKIYERYQKMENKKILDIKLVMRDIVEEQETMNRIMAAYHSLDERQKDILSHLYIENPEITIKIKTYDLAEKYKYSCQNILKIRKKAIDQIMNLYNSDLTQFEIYKQRNADCFDKNSKYR